MDTIRRFLPTLVLVVLGVIGCEMVPVSVAAAQERLRHTTEGFVGCYQLSDIDAFIKAAAAKENAAVYMLAAEACFMVPDADVNVEATSGKWVRVRVASNNKFGVPVGTKLWGWRGGLTP